MKQSFKTLLVVATAWLTGTSAFALDKLGDVYQIATGDDLVAFANLVNGDAAYSGAAAVLTADIDLSGKEFPTIGRDASRYWGTFDGQGHRIMNMSIVGTTKELGMFNVVSTATIKNLILDSSCIINSGDCTAALIGCCNGSGTLTIENVGIECDVKGTGANGAAFLGCNYSNGNIAVKITNCYNTGNISAGWDTAVFCGWFANNGETRVTNCWNTGKVTGADGNNSLGRGIGAGQFVDTYDLNAENGKISETILAGFESSWRTSGQLAYVLNGSQSTSVTWYQTIGSDAHPMPFGTAVVYANGSQYCDGTAKPGLVYENVDKGTARDDHNYNEWGFCSNEHDGITCNDLQLDFMTPVDGFYEIGNNKQLNWFAYYVNNVGQSVNGRLTADVDFSSQAITIGVSESKPFRGTFDGQGHTVTVNVVNSGAGRTGFFAYVNSATIRNLVVDGTATSAGNNCVGGLGGRSDGDGTLIENVVVKTAVSYTGSNSDATCGGFFANMESGATLRNCAFLGSINTGTAEGNGGLVGWAGGGSSIKFVNCLVAPSAYTKTGNSADYARNNPSTTNCYNIAADDARLASGEMAYLLNEGEIVDVAWHQVIGTDAYPVPFGTAVVYGNGELYCDGTSKGGALVYSNVNEVHRDAHNYGEWGFCTNKNGADETCDDIQPGYATLTDGYYQIGNARQLNWFAVWTARKDATVSARLTADIDMTEVANFPGIGSEANTFTGTFDGQRHVISNMTMNWDREGVGLINRAANGASLKNVTIAANSTFRGSKAVAGLIGGLYGGGNVYIENCGNEASVQTTGQNAGGVCGVCYNGTILHLTNVYNVGEITGATAGESGSLSGWMQDAVLKNCYSIAGYATSDNTHGLQQGNQFARGGGISLTNCYDYGTGDWGLNNSTWGSAFEGGRKITEVNETTMGRMFAGLYDAEGGSVWRMEYDGWAHPVLYEPAAAVLSENVPNRFEAGNAVTLTLKRSAVADTWNTLCLPFALTAAQIETVFGEGAKVAEKTGVAGTTVQFTTVTAIEAGKAYLVMPTKAVESAEVTVDLVAGAPAVDDVFQGVYEPTAIAEGTLIVAADNKLAVSAAGTIKGFRAYFPQTAGTRFTDFTVDGETTGISLTSDFSSKGEGSIYSIDGRRVAQPTKGLYIVNGRKVVIK